MPGETLSLLGVAEGIHVAPKTIRRWHELGLISALRVGRNGLPWVFDAPTFRTEVAALPKCGFEGCDKPVAEEGAGCKAHCRALLTRGKPRSPEHVEKIARSLRKYEDREYHCDDCGDVLKEHRGHAVARRRARTGALRCGSCAAKERHKVHPYSKGRWRDCPSCGGGPFWVTPSQERDHCRLCFRTAPDVRAKRSASLRLYIATAEGREHHERILTMLHAFHAEIPKTLEREGLIGIPAAARLIAVPRHRIAREGVLTLERREFGRLVRVAVRAREVGDAAQRATGSTAVHGKLNRPLAAAKGKTVGRPRELDEDTVERVLKRAARGQSQRQIADYEDVSRPQVQRLLAGQKVVRNPS